MSQPLVKLENYITETDTYRCNIALPKFCRKHYKFFQNYNNYSQSIINVRIYLSHFLYFRGLNFTFSSFRDAFVSGVGRRKVKKYYDKYISMLTIRDDYVDNYFSDKFVLLCHIGYFTNGDRRKLTVGYIYHTFYTFMD